jgi:hypothetical protein
MAQAQHAKDTGRYVEHGVVVNPEENKFHGQKDAPAAAAEPKKFPNAAAYQGSFADAAMAQAQKAKDAGRYQEHGIVMNPAENQFHGQKK